MLIFFPISFNKLLVAKATRILYCFNLFDKREKEKKMKKN